MANKPPGYGSRRTSKDSEPASLSENSFRYVDPIDRWRQEYERYAKAEENLLKISKLSYDPVDYAPLLIPVPWKERPIPDFGFLVEEARVAAETKFFMPIVSRLAGFIVSLIILMISSNSAFLWAAGTLSITLLLWLLWTIQQRQSSIETAVADARAEADNRTEQEQLMIAEAKKQHEDAEAERIFLVEKLLAGDIAAVFLRLDNILSRYSLPFSLEVHIDYYANVPLIQILLPNKSVIPVQTCSLLPSGRVKYTDKEPRLINKQYIELCSALIMHIMSVLYATIPSFDQIYVWGVLKGTPDHECFFEIATSREAAVKALNAENGIAAVKQLNGQFETDTILNLKLIEPARPEEWGNVPQQLLRSMHIHVAK
jgi:hypothetical protein